MKVYVLIEVIPESSNQVTVFKLESLIRQRINDFCREVGRNDYTNEEYLTGFVDLENGTWLEVYESEIVDK